MADEGVGRLNGDLDLNGQVAFEDFLILSSNFGKSGIAWSGGDVVPSGDVGFEDFLLFAANFGQVGSKTAAVPEPGSSALLLTLGVSLFAMGRKGRE